MILLIKMSKINFDYNGEGQYITNSNSIKQGDIIILENTRRELVETIKEEDPQWGGKINTLLRGEYETYFRSRWDYLPCDGGGILISRQEKQRIKKNNLEEEVKKILRGVGI